MTPLTLFLLVALTMTAFAANSVFNRMALAGGLIAPGDFAAIRLASGALALLAVLRWQAGAIRLAGQRGWIGPVTLLAYMAGFSYAYVSLDAGLGALILFGGVQVTMFAGALIGGERPPLRRWLGAGIALSGLVWLLWPGASAAPPVAGAVLMLIAAVGWGVFSLRGRGVDRPMTAMAAAFTLAAPAAIALALGMGLAVPGGSLPTGAGVALAAVSGMVTSAMGYALWYALLPRLAASVAAVAQVTVPVIAMAGGAVLLAEPVTPRLALAAALAAALVLGGVALSVLPLGGLARLAQRTMGSSGS